MFFQLRASGGLEPSAVRQRPLVVTGKAHLAAVWQWVDRSQQVLPAWTSKAVPCSLEVYKLNHSFI